MVLCLVDWHPSGHGIVRCRLCGHSGAPPDALTGAHWHRTATQRTTALEGSSNGLGSGSSAGSGDHVGADETVLMAGAIGLKICGPACDFVASSRGDRGIPYHPYCDARHVITCIVVSSVGPRGLPSRSPKEPAIGRGDMVHAIPAERAIRAEPGVYLNDDEPELAASWSSLSGTVPSVKVPWPALAPVGPNRAYEVSANAG